MRFNRREFIGIGAAGALGTLGYLRSGSRITRGESLPPPGPHLRMRFKGLCLLEHRANARTMVVHLVDARGVGLAEHLIQMIVPKNAIDSAATKAIPDCTDEIGGTTFLTWHLRRSNVEGPRPQGEPDLIVREDVPGNPEKPNPDNDEGWKSMHWVPDLGVLCRAKEVTRPADQKITLHHGEFRSIRADGSGPHAVWKFELNNAVVMRRRLTNRVMYLCPSSTPLTISVNSDPIVFRAGTDVTIRVENQPICKPHGGPLNMNHFTKFYDLIDAQDRPIPSVHEFPPPHRAAVEPNYCPHGRIRI
jgi:hypothetical protein